MRALTAAIALPLAAAAAALAVPAFADVKDGVDAARARHKPVVDGECTSCHSPHQSALDTLLLAKGSDLCLGCHKDIKASLALPQVHSPAARDCLRCHKPHASAEPTLMTQPVRTVCADCHDLKAPAFSTAHLDIDPAVIRCERCHDAHGSKEPKLFKSTAHAPFAMKSCTDCHLAPSGVKR